MKRRRKKCVGYEEKKEVKCRMERRRKRSAGWREEGREVLYKENMEYKYLFHILYFILTVTL